MTGLSLALANLKPGTGKTTSAVWLAHVFAWAGNSVLLVDADPSGSALEWSDLAAMDPRLAPQQAFPFRIVALPSRELHRRLPEIARDDDVVIIDTPQIEDHAAIARSALRYADEIVIPCAPNPIEINRTTPVRDEIAELEPVRGRPARSAILLNRCITRAHSISDARHALDRSRAMTCWPPRCRGWRCTPRASACRSRTPAATRGAGWPASWSPGALRRAGCGPDHATATRARPVTIAASGRATIWHGHCRFEAALAAPVIMHRLPLLVPPLVKAARPSRANSHKTLPHVPGMIGVSVSARLMTVPPRAQSGPGAGVRARSVSRQPRACKASVLCISLWIV